MGEMRKLLSPNGMIIPYSHNLHFVVLGLPVWILVDGTWSELSKLADRIPESYNISCYLMLCISIGNIAPLTIGHYLKGKSQSFLKSIIYKSHIFGVVSFPTLSKNTTC